MLMVAEKHKYQQGDDCPLCHDGQLIVVQTIVGMRFRHRYLGCNACGKRPENNKLSVPIEYAPPRKKLRK